MELGQLLQLLDDWLATGHEQIGTSLAHFIGIDGYGVETLRDDLARFMFLLGETINCRPAWQWRFVTGPCTSFYRAHERTEPEGRGCPNERSADSRSRTVRGFEPAGGGIAPCRPPGIPGAGFVLVQEFEGVMR
jgi:hypothetical protein